VLVGDLGLADVHEVRFTGGHRLSLQVQFLPRMSLLFLLVFMHSLDERLPATTDLDVFHADVDTLADDAAANDPVDSDANGPHTHVEDSASLAMVALVGHAHGLSGVSLDVHVVATVEGRKIAGNRNCAVTSEALREEIPGLTTLSVAMRHFYPLNLPC